MTPSDSSGEARRSVPALERLLSPVDRVPIAEAPGELPKEGPRIVALAGDTAPEWLSSGDLRVYARPSRASAPDGITLATIRASNGDLLDVVSAGEVSHIPFSLSEAHDNLVSERWREGAGDPGLPAWQLAAFYRVKRIIPRRVQVAVRQLAVRRQTLPEFPSWPFEPAMVRLVELYARALAHALDRADVQFIWYWPHRKSAAAVLTHDVESAEGLRLAVDVADLEQARGLRSSFNVVASWYPIDHSILRELTDRGFEIGVHGVYHDRSMFSSPSAFAVQTELVRQAAKDFGAEGFRSPSTHRVFDWLGKLPVAYDCTIPHSDPYEPIPGGCCSVWPFFIGDVVELPYTLPQDHTLFTLLGHTSIEIWAAQLERLENAHGLIQCVTHPDPGYLGRPRHRSLYSEFLSILAGRNELWNALPRDVARWWRARDDGRVKDGSVARMRFGAHFGETSVDFVNEQ